MALFDIETMGLDGAFGILTIHEPMIFPPNKDINGSLHGRVIRQWRGRKHVVWVPWAISDVQDISMYSLDVEDELAEAYLAQFGTESSTPSPEATLEMMRLVLEELSDLEYEEISTQAKELLDSIKFD